MGDVESRDYEAACFKEKEYARRAVDSVIPGDSESEEVHQLTGEDHLDGENVYGKTYGWRGTQEGGTSRIDLPSEKVTSRWRLLHVIAFARPARVSSTCWWTAGPSSRKT